MQAWHVRAVRWAGCCPKGQRAAVRARHRARAAFDGERVCMTYVIIEDASVWHATMRSSARAFRRRSQNSMRPLNSVAWRSPASRARCSPAGVGQGALRSGRILPRAAPTRGRRHAAALATRSASAHALNRRFRVGQLPATSEESVVEPGGIEPPTSALPVRRSPS
jgi:hypothetical protein